MDIVLKNILFLIGDERGAKTKFLKSLGLPSSTMGDWQRGRNKSYMKRLPDIAKYFSISVEQLTDEDLQRNNSSPNVLLEEKIQENYFDFSIFWEIFKKLCLNIGKSPNAVAKELNISSGSVSEWKKGRVPHNSTLLKVSKYFNVSTNYLLGFTEEKNSQPDTESNETIRHYTEPIERQGKNIGIVPIKHKPLNNEFDELTQTMLELFSNLSTIDKCNVISYIEKLNKK